MFQKNTITEVPPNTLGFYSNIFLVCKASGGWRPVIDLKQRNAHIYAPHFCMHTISSVEKGDYLFKIDLQDAYFHVLINPDSRKYLLLPLKGISFPSTSLWSEHCPSGIYSSEAHSGCLPPLSGNMGNPISRRMVIHHPDCQALICHQSQLLKTLDLVGFKLTEGKSELDPVQDIQFLGLRLCLDQGRASLRVLKAWEIIACVCLISSHPFLSYTQVSHFMASLSWASGLIPLGLLHLRPLQQHTFHS